jgi:LuxR family maltose regulon positive regulatory protein
METIAKITRPSTEGIIPRKRLFQRLDHARSRPVIFVTGPPGSGKTNLISSYIKYRKLPCLWYQVDESDADIASFFYYMGIAAKHAAPRRRKPLPLLTPEYLIGIKTFTLRYFEGLFNRFHPFTSSSKGSFLIVLDNFQEVPELSLFQEIIRDGISRIPKGITFIILSRNEYPKAFTPLQANRLLELIGWDDLRLRFDETEGMIRQIRRERIDDGTLHQFHNKADGWAAGLVLIVERARTVPAESVTDTGFTLKEVFNYFAGEIFEKADAETQAFLLKTSFFHRFTSDMAGELTQNPEAARIMSDLIRRNYFTQKHGLGAQVYQYHSLFREFLLAGAREAFCPEELTHIRHEAARLCEANGYDEYGIRLFLEAGQWGDATRLILKQSQAMIAQGRWQSLQGWIKSLPRHIYENDPWLLYWMGLCILPISPGESGKYFEKAFELFRPGKDAVGSYLSLSGMFDSVSYHFGSIIEFDRLIPMLYDLRKEIPDYPSPMIEALVVSCMLYALSMRQPQHPDIRYWEARGLSLAESISDLDRKAYLFGVIALMQTFFGELKKAAIIMDLFRRAVITSRVTPMTKVFLKDVEAFHSFLSGDFERNRMATEEGMAVADFTGVHVLDAMILGNGAAGALSKGDIKRADDLLKRMRSSLEGGQITWVECYYHVLTAWKGLLQKDFVRASLHADLAIKFGKESGYAPTEAYNYLVKGLAMQELRKEDEASVNISEARRICRTINVYQAEFRCLLAEAQFAFDRGEEGHGKELLRGAMALGRERGYENAFFWAPSEMAKLCVKALEAEIEVDYVRDLVRKRNLVPDQPPYGCGQWPWPLKIFTLGRFEIFVDGKPVEFSGKTQKRPLLCLKVLISLGAIEVKEELLEDILWPEADGDVAHQSFETTLHRLRKWLGYSDALRFSGGLVTLDRRLCWTDVWTFETLVEEADAMKQGKTDRAVETTEKAIFFYKGAFLPGETEEPWTVSLRERLRRKFLRCVNWIGHCQEEAGQWEKALACYERGLEVDNISEDFYQRLMICYQYLGRNAEALSAYERCRNILSTALGVKPSARTEAIRKSLL